MGPLSSKCGKYETAKARLWTKIESFSRQTSFNPSKLFPLRWQAVGMRPCIQPYAPKSQDAENLESKSLQPIPDTLHLNPQHPAPKAQPSNTTTDTANHQSPNPTRQTLGTKPRHPNLKPQTLNPTHYALDPRTQSPHPKPTNS